MRIFTIYKFKFITISLIGFILGLVCAFLIFRPSFGSPKLVPDTIESLLLGHLELISSVSKNAVVDQAEYQKQILALNSNTTSLTLLISKTLDREKSQKFNSAWKAQDEAYLRYITAMKDGYTGNALGELPQITSFPKTLAALFTSADLEQILSQYVASIKTIIDANLVRDYTTVDQQLTEAKNQITHLSKLLTPDSAPNETP
jgi:hypothetical protein